MKIPYIHVGGTSFNELFSKAEKAKETLHAALKAFAELTPHGRDYFKADEYKVAAQKHRESHHKLYDLVKEVDDYVVDLYNSNCTNG